jgi:hypothetical protein
MLLTKLKKIITRMFLNKKKYTEGIFEGKVVYIVTMNETYALVTFTKDSMRMFKVGIEELTELK